MAPEIMDIDFDIVNWWLERWPMRISNHNSEPLGIKCRFSSNEYMCLVNESMIAVHSARGECPERRWDRNDFIDLLTMHVVRTCPIPFWHRCYWSRLVADRDRIAVFHSSSGGVIFEYKSIFAAMRAVKEGLSA